MEPEAKQAVREFYQTCVGCLEPRYLLAPLFERDVLTLDEYEKWLENDAPVELQCQQLLALLYDRCSFEDFLYALRAEDNEILFGSLADDLEKTVESLRWERDAKVATTPKKSPVQSSERRLLLRLSMEFKQLAQGGATQKDKFDKLFSKVQERWLKAKAAPASLDPDKRALLSSYMFTALDSKAGSLRVMYNMDLYDTDLLKQMAELAPMTVNPRLSTVALLARRGTALSMRLPLAQALAALEEGESQTLLQEPCKESALIFYEKTNLLLQRFQVAPTLANKEAVIEAARLAEIHFWHEDNFTLEQKEQCGLMATLKVVFAHLGIGVFGQTVEGVRVRESDKREAQAILERAQRSLGGMEARRQMMFHIAQAVLSFRQADPYEAMASAQLAEGIAQRGKFRKEEENIQRLMEDIKELSV